MKIFVRHSHLHGEFLGFFVAVSVAVFVILYVRSDEITLFAAISTILGLFMFAFGYYFHARRIGLYISETDIYYRGIRKKFIDSQEIKAIRISKAYRHHRHGRPTPIVDLNGNQKYTMFLLHTYYPWDMHSPDAPGSGDLSFEVCHRQCIFSYTVYDQAAIDYLKTLNPSIVVIPPEGSEPERVTGPVRGWITLVTRKDWTWYRSNDEDKKD